MKLIASLLAVTAALSLVGVALAGVRFSSRVTIQYAVSAEAFLGKVRSEKPACRRHRQVTLYFKQRRHGTPHEVGSDRTGRHGAWAVADPAAGMKRLYYARAAGRSIAAGRCAPDRSRILRSPGG